MWKTSIALVTGAVAVALGTGLTTSASAAEPASTAKLQCAIDSQGAVTADALRVRTRPSTHAGVVGQIPYGNAFHYCSSSYTSADDYVWVFGFGYAGRTKYTGWAASEFIAHP